MTTDEELENARTVVHTLTERLNTVSRERAALVVETQLLSFARHDLKRLLAACEPVAAWLKAGVPIPGVRDGHIWALEAVLKDLREPKPKKEKK